MKKLSEEQKIRSLTEELTAPKVIEQIKFELEHNSDLMKDYAWATLEWGYSLQESE